jgi:hypothetical protein
MTKLKPTPMQARVPLGAMRWIVDNMSGQSVMKAGEMAEVTRESMSGFGRQTTERHFVFGTPTVGGPIPDDMTMGAYIDMTGEVGVYIVTVRAKSFVRTEIVMGGEVFHRFGFAAPCD